MKKLLMITVIAGLCMAGLSSCTKEVVGPEGPQGPQGPAGNANVKTAVFKNQAFVQNPLADTIYQVDLSVAEITQGIVQKGQVSVYVAEGNSTNTIWTALPGRFSPDVGVVNPVLLDMAYSTGSVNIYTYGNPNIGNIDVKVVVTAGN